MSNDAYLIIDGPDEHHLSLAPPTDLSNYRQYAGPYAGLAPFSKVFAKVSVGGARVAEICASYISGGAQ